MEITISIPDKFIPAEDVDGDISRQILEAYAIQNYREEKMSLGRIAELLDLSIDEAHGFLKEHNIPSNYDWKDLTRDRRTLEILFKKTAADSND